MSFEIDQAIARFDFVDFLGSHGNSVELQGTQLVGYCPFCQWRRVSFRLSPANGLWICHYCGESGNAIGLIRQVAAVSAKEAIELLTEGSLFAEPAAATPLVMPSAPAKVGLPNDFEALVLPLTTGTRRFWRYATHRKLTPSLVRRYGIGFCRVGRYASRLIVPVKHEDEVVSFVARDITGTQTKVDTPPGNDQGSYLFNLDNIKGDAVVLMEGVFDALMLPDLAVASFGKKISVAQIERLLRAKIKQALLCWDSDAKDEIEAAANSLCYYFDIAFIDLPDAADPNDLGPEVMREAVKRARFPQRWT